jgi:hypothetical protein
MKILAAIVCLAFVSCGPDLESDCAGCTPDGGANPLQPYLLPDGGLSINVTVNVNNNVNQNQSQGQQQGQTQGQAQTQTGTTTPPPVLVAPDPIVCKNVCVKWEWKCNKKVCKKTAKVCKKASQW